MLTLSVSTNRANQIVDLTDQVQQALDQAGGRADGVACVSVPHCTCAVYLNENESGLLQDTLDLIGSAVGGAAWRHDRIDDNAGAHLAASLLGNAVLIPVRQGRLHLGTWQRVLLVELDGPRHRTVNLTLLAEAT